MNASLAWLHNFLFNVFPYVCLAVFLMGNLLFHLDREFQPAEAVQPPEQSGHEEEA